MSGVKLIALGLFKKVVVADNLGLVVDRVYGDASFQGLSLIVATFLFGWQIYGDFSGYTDIARGSAKLLGIRLRENFKTPYLATSITDFWRRWHMSLSFWLRDYLYICLGGNRRGLGRTCLNLMITFVLCGLWHGANLTFLAWGFFHGMIMVGERLGGGWLFVKKLAKLPFFIKVIYTNVIVGIGWVLFRAENIEEAGRIYLGTLRGVKNFLTGDYLRATMAQVFNYNFAEMVIVAFCFMAIILIELVSNRVSLGKAIGRLPRWGRWGIYLGGCLSIIYLRNIDVQEFIYFQF
jgi:D-alanyl-lipoteichoic acid acyltransferase DltB (MBOAT superfamily)